MTLVDRNCVLMHPTDQLTRRVRLPLISLPHEWHEDQRRPACIKTNPVKGRKYPSTPPTLEEAMAIIEALRTRTPAKWRKRWGNTDERNATLAAFLIGTGLRIHEALLAKPKDVDPAHNTVHVVRGKGGKERYVPISPFALAELEKWLEIRAGLGFTNEHPIFCVLEGPTKGGMMDQAYVRDRLTAAGKAAGVDKRVVCHQWRHAYALHLHRGGVPVKSIQRALGHSNLATTSVYLDGLSATEILDDVLSAWDDGTAVDPLEQAMATIAELEAKLAALGVS